VRYDYGAQAVSLSVHVRQKNVWHLKAEVVLVICGQCLSRSSAIPIQSHKVERG
jgi:hypothetical protein